MSNCNFPFLVHTLLVTHLADSSLCSDWDKYDVMQPHSVGPRLVLDFVFVLFGFWNFIPCDCAAYAASQILMLLLSKCSALTHPMHWVRLERQRRGVCWINHKISTRYIRIFYTSVCKLFRFRAALTELFLSRQTMAEYTSLLSDLAENITNEDLEQLKSACKEDIPEDQSNNITSSKEWFSYLEKNDKLAQGGTGIHWRPDSVLSVAAWTTSIQCIYQWTLLLGSHHESNAATDSAQIKLFQHFFNYFGS